MRKNEFLEYYDQINESEEGLNEKIMSEEEAKVIETFLKGSNIKTFDVRILDIAGKYWSLIMNKMKDYYDSDVTKLLKNGLSRISNEKGEIIFTFKLKQ